MPTLEYLMERADPVSPDLPSSEVYRRFEAAPDALVIPVVVDGRPVGLIERNDFLLKLAGPLGQALYAGRSAQHVMDPEPAVVEGGVEVAGFCESMMRSGPDALLRGFIVTRDGLYVGVGTVVAMLQAAHDEQRGRNEELRAQVNELQNGQAQALATARTKSQFLTVMGQELRAPMTDVLAVVDLLRRTPLGAQARGHVASITESCQSLLHTLDDAEDLLRAEAGELELKPASTGLRNLMDEIQTRWSPHASREDISLLISYEGDTELAAEIDGARVRQVLDNLIGNALKFARGGVVEASLRATATGERVSLQARVRDDGPGVQPDQLDTIFEPFVHGPGPDGAGLGLAVSRRLLERMDGRIWVENNAGRGATFAFELSAPRTQIEAPASSNVTTLNDTSVEMDRSPHILVVDDNATNRVVAQALCEMFGCSSETVQDGVEALEAVGQRRFDVILMDIKMPRMDGLQATAAIRALDGPASLTPIIALTANADPDDARRYLEAGMVAVVEKPIKPERLRMAINTALEAAQEQAAQVEAEISEGVRGAA